MTKQQKAVLESALDTAHRDAKEYLCSVHAMLDMGDDWLAMIKRKEQEFRELANLLRALSMNATRWEVLADTLEVKAYNFENEVQP